MALIEIPGEKLLIRLWETAEKFGGSVLKPWQMRREGLVSIELRRAELLMLAQVEVEATQIKQGGLTQTVELLPAPSQPTDLQTSLQITHASHEYSYIEAITERNMKAEAVRKEIALAKAVIHAEDELKNDPSPAPDVSVSDDWLLRWRDYAAGVSSDELQSIWGKVLAGEVKAPGCYSLRTLEFLRNLSQQEAQLLEKISSHVVSGFIYSSSQTEMIVKGFTFGELLELQEQGIISGVDGLGLNNQRSSSIQEKYKSFLLCKTRILLVESEDSSKTLTLRVAPLTAIGKQIMQLIHSEPNEEMLHTLAENVKAQGFFVQIGSFGRLNESQMHYFNMQTL